MQRNLRIVLWLVLATFAHTARADSPQSGQPGANGPSALKNLTLEQLSQIEVTTPSKEPTKVSQTPAAIYVITGEDIRRSGATCIPEALRLAPGVEVARIDSNKWSIGIRGFGSRLTRSVLVLIDGRTVYTPLFDGTYWEVQDTMMEDIDRIEVIRGPGGTIWGPNAVNGVINVITKSAQDTRGMLATVGGGDFEQGFADFRYGGGNANGFNYRIYGKGFTRGPEDHSDGRNFDDWRATQTGFRMDWKAGARDAFTVQGDAYDEIAGESVQATSYTQPYSQIVDANAYLSGGNILGHWKRTLSEGNDIQVQAYYDRTNRHEPNFGENRNTLDVDFLQRLRLPARNEVSWGLGARGGPVHDIEVVSGLTFIPFNRTDDLFTGFFQDEIGLVNNRLSLTLGTKLLRTNFTNFGAEPSARLLWTPTENQTIWAAFTHALRTPSDAEENFFLSGYIGNPRRHALFRPFQRELQLRAGATERLRTGISRPSAHESICRYRGVLQSLSRSVQRRHHRTDLSEATPAPAHLLLPAQFGNGLLGYTKGVEIAPEWRPTDFLAAAGVLLLPAHEYRQSAAFGRRGHRAWDRGVESAAPGGGSIGRRFLEAPSNWISIIGT